MTRSLFVTGTGTGIGKTWLCCRLLEALPAGFGVRCIKPVVTGFDPARPADSDTGLLLGARRQPPGEEAIDRTSPWRYRAPISADMAARRENRPLPFDELVEFSRAPAGTDLNLIEGIGGVMAPLDHEHTVLDWIAALETDVLLVAGSYLGSLSHTLTAFAALASRARTPAAIVLSQSPDEPVPAAESAATLQRFCKGVPVLVMPRGATANAVEVTALLQVLLPEI